MQFLQLRKRAVHRSLDVDGRARDATGKLPRFGGRVARAVPSLNPDDTFAASPRVPGASLPPEGAELETHAASAPSNGAPAAVAWGLLTVFVWVLVSESRFAFDKAETLWLYPEVTNLGLWRWVADFTFGVGFGAAAFYRTVALLFAAAYVWIVRWLAARSTVLALSFAALFLSWFGFGQLRYGTALTLLMISIALQGNRPRLALVVGTVASLVHVAVAAGTLLFVGWMFMARRSVRWALLPVVLMYALVGIFGVGGLTQAVLGVTGYANYLNWLSLDSPNTVYKYVYLCGVLLGSWAIARRPFWRELSFALMMLPTSVSPPLAGRGYFFVVSVTLASLYAREEHGRPPAWVTGLLCLPLIGETLLLWRGEQFTFFSF
jgi:hypothetical protein